MDENPKGKRAYSRIRIRTEAEVHSAKDTRMVRGRIRDLSAKGIYVTALGSLPAGELCEMRILIPGESPICASGQVVRAENGGMAILFTRIAAESLVYLKKTILLHAEDPAATEKEFG